MRNPINQMSTVDLVTLVIEYRRWSTLVWNEWLGDAECTADRFKHDDCADAGVDKRKWCSVCRMRHEIPERTE